MVDNIIEDEPGGIIEDEAGFHIDDEGYSSGEVITLTLYSPMTTGISFKSPMETSLTLYSPMV